jgi:hypothetical protein
MIIIRSPILVKRKEKKRKKKCYHTMLKEMHPTEHRENISRRTVIAKVYNKSIRTTTDSLIQVSHWYQNLEMHPNLQHKSIKIDN